MFLLYSGTQTAPFLQGAPSQDCNKQRMALQCELRYKQKIALKLSNVLKKEGKFLKKLWCCVSGRVDKVKLITVKNIKADVSSVSLSSKRITKANARNLNFGVVIKQ